MGKVSRHSGLVKTAEWKALLGSHVAFGLCMRLTWARATGGTCQPQSLICDMSVVLKAVCVEEGRCGLFVFTYAAYKSANIN